MQNTRVLKDLACVKLEYLVGDIETKGDKRSLAFALERMGQVEAYLQTLLVLAHGDNGGKSGLEPPRPVTP